MLAALKIGLFGGFFTTIMSTVVGDAAGEIVVITAALTAIGWLWTRMLLPAARAFKRTHDAVGALEDLGQFMADQRSAVATAQGVATQAIDAAHDNGKRLDLIERHIGLFAAEDAVRARGAMQQLVDHPPPAPG